MKICVTCGKEFPSSYRDENGQPRSLHNRKNCLDCQPRGSSPHANRYPTKEARKKAQRKRGASSSKRWRDRYITRTGKDPIKETRQKRRKHTIDAIGGGCQNCGYSKTARNLTFHHLHDKEFALNERAFQFAQAKLIKELRKCALVCHNCHGEIHEGLIPESEVLVWNAALIEAIAGLQLPRLKDG